MVSSRLVLPSFRLIVDYATLPGPPDFLSSTWCTLYPLPITQDDVAVWPYSVDFHLVFSSFLASLHWPQGVSEFLILERLCSPRPPSP